jgi:hypothetical protein
MKDRAERELDSIPEVRRAKALRRLASALDLAHSEPIPSHLEQMSSDGRKRYGLVLFENSGLSKRGYWRESGHESWTHARSLVTPGTERIPTPLDLWVLTKLVLLLSIQQREPQKASWRRAS